jgi:FlaA1/EpsC-like NDP-sugar epimerase
MLDIIQHRRKIVVVFELALVVAANYLAFLLRFGGDISPLYFSFFVQTIPIVLGIRALMFIPFRLYEGLWRYTGIWDLRNIAAAVGSSTAVLYLVFTFVLRLFYPRSILLIDGLLLLFFMTGIRLTKRIYRGMGGGRRQKGILIYGAGDAGEMVVRDMKNNPFYKMDPVGSKSRFQHYRTS